MRSGRFLSACAVTAAALILPGLYLLHYQRQFGLDPTIVVFGHAVILLAVALFGLAVVGVSVIRARSGRPLPAWLFGIAAGLMSAMVAFIFAGTRISNIVWGDTLNYQLVLTFGAHLGAVLDFLPATAFQKHTLLAMLLAAAAAYLLTAFLVVGAAAWSLSAHADKWLRERPGRRARVAGGLGALLVLTAGVCVTLAVFNPRSLQGEPLSGFFQLFPASKLHELDNARLAAAVEDRANHAAYPKPASFKRKNVVLVMMDSLRADHTGPYGYHRDTTPFLSELYRKKQLHRVDMALSTCSESYCGIASTLGRSHFISSRCIISSCTRCCAIKDIASISFLVAIIVSWNYLFDYYGSDIDALHNAFS